MRIASPQLRFLLRGSTLLLLLLALWWFVLLQPLLSGLRLFTELALHLVPGSSSVASVIVAPNTDWLLRVPIPESLAKQEAVQKAFGRAPGAPLVQVHSFKLAIAERTPTFFTLSFPLFWALILAGPWSRSLWRAAAVGSALLALLAVLSLLLYTAYTIQTSLKLASSSLAVGLWGAVEYLNVNVVSYLAPLLIAVWLQKELRAQIFSWEVPVAPAPASPVETDKSRRGRYRGR